MVGRVQSQAALREQSNIATTCFDADRETCLKQLQSAVSDRTQVIRDQQGLVQIRAGY